MNRIATSLPSESPPGIVPPPSPGPFPALERPGDGVRGWETSHGPGRAADGEGLIQLSGLEKRFTVRRGWRDTFLSPGARVYHNALVDVTLAVGRGEFFGLLGRNGAGKTTLFKILATLLLPDGGSVRVGGEDVVERPEVVRRRLVPVIPYERSLYWRLSARENLRLYSVLQGHRGAGARDRVGRTLEVVGLEKVGDRQVGLFSSGMKQRLLIARALLSEPDVLLLDEPTRSLDPVTARDLRRFLKEEINGRRGCTVLLATHDADEVRELCHRVGILDEGRLLAAGATEKLLGLGREARFHLVARGNPQGHLRDLELRGAVGAVSVSPSPEDGWWEVEMDVAGGRPAASAVLAGLCQAGVEVASFAPKPVPLAEFIESVVAWAHDPEVR